MKKCNQNKLQNVKLLIAKKNLKCLPQLRKPLLYTQKFKLYDNPVLCYKLFLSNVIYRIRQEVIKRGGVRGEGWESHVW